MIESQLTQYGIFGLWTLFNLYLIKYLIIREENQNKELREVVKNNTLVLGKFIEKTNL